MFSGIGGFELGLEQSNLEHQLIGFSEVDKYAISIFEQKFQGVKNYGDATTIRGDELPDFDLLVGGFPCQAFSVAGLQKGFGDTRGTLFFDIARICSEKRPQYVVLENVKGLLSHDKGKTFQTILGVLADMGYRIEWQVLNSKNFGVPQNRERVFIVGHLGNRSPRKVFPITGSNPERGIKIFGYLGHGGQKDAILEVDGLSTSLTATDYKQPKQIKLVDIINKKGNSKNNSQSGSVYSTDGISTTVSGQRVNSQGYIETKLRQTGVIGKDSEATRVYDINGLSRTIKYGGGQGAKTGLYKDQGRIRRLTPTECERLQGFPDGWTEGLSDTQRYKTLGNAVTSVVITEIFNNF